MANKKISELTAITAANTAADDVFAVVDTSSTETKKISRDELKTAVAQSGAEIKTAYEAEANAFTDAQFTKLAGIEAGATADQSDAEIRTAVEAATDSNVFTDADHTKLNGIAAGANNYVHPNHTGEVTSTADGATVIADNVVDEANLKVSNAPTNGYALTAQSAAAGGLTWAAVSGGSYTDSDVDTHLNTGTAATNEVLSWTGTDYDWVAQSGGGGADLYSANEVSVTTQPSATGDDAVAIGDSASAAAANSFAIGHTASTSSAAAYGIALGRNASVTGNNGAAVGYNSTAGQQAVALGTSSVASGNNSLAGPNATASATNSYALGQSASASNFGGAAFGKGATTAVNNYNVAIGNSYTSGEDAFSAAIANNTSSYGATGANSIAMGYQAKSSGAKSIALSGENSLASGSKSFAAGGEYQTASGAFSVALGGSVNTASGESSYAFGVRSTATKVGQYAFGCWIGQQAGLMVLKADTTDATPKAMASNNNAAGGTNQLILPDNAAYAFHGTIVARQKASEGTACAAWKVEGLIRREGSAATTVLVNSATTVLDNTPSWGMALSADTTNGALKIQVTGASSTNVKWTAQIHSAEITYA